MVAGAGALVTLLLNLIDGKTINDYPNFLVTPTPGAFFGLAVFSICFVWGYFKIVYGRSRRVLDFLAAITLVYGIILFSSVDTWTWAVSLSVILCLEMFTALFVHY